MNGRFFWIFSIPLALSFYAGAGFAQSVDVPSGDVPQVEPVMIHDPATDHLSLQLDGIDKYCSRNSVDYNQQTCDKINKYIQAQSGPNAPKKAVSTSGYTGDCQAALTFANQQCVQGGTASKVAGAAQMGLNNVGGADAYARCMAMKMQSMTASAGSAIVLKSCMSAVSNCVNVCQSNMGTTPSNGTAIKTCRQMGHDAKLIGVVSMGFSGMTAAQMSQCNSIIQANQSGLCGPGSTNPLCTFSGGTTGLGGVPGGAGGIGAAGGGFPSGVPGVPNDPAGVGGTDTNGNMYNGNPPGQHQAPPGGLANDQASAGGGIGGGGGYPGGAGGNNNGGGGGGASFKTDIGGGLSNGGGYSVTSVPTSESGGVRNNAGGGNGADRLDLSRFLPGGDLDPARRGPASLGGLTAQGVTGANDLSNFEKVTRMMNKKRPFLLP